MSEGTGIPVVSVVGKSDSGKTTLMERIISALTDRGYRVGAVKHHVHDFDIDVPGKDSWRHGRAGAVVTLVSSPTKLGMVKHTDHEASLEELLGYAGEIDVLLTEGYRRAGKTRIEISRRARSTELTCDPKELFALVTDNPDLECGAVPRFGLDDTTALVDLIESTFLGGRTTAGDPAPGMEVHDGD